MTNADPGGASTSDIRAVARVGEICALFGPHVEELTAADVAERTGLNRTTAYRYCSSMVAAGILERGSRRGTFALGGRMLELGIRALRRKRVVEIADPYLRRLRSTVRMTSVLSILGAQWPVVALVHEDLSRATVLTVHPGSTLDTTAAQTIIFLAFGDTDAIGHITEGVTPAERARLDAEVLGARRKGYSVLRQSDGTFSVAAPVFDERGLSATVAILGAGSLEDIGSRVDALLETTQALGAELGADLDQAAGC